MKTVPLAISKKQNFWQRIKAFFRTLFLGLEQFDKESIDGAINVVEALKNGCEFAEIVAAATPTHIDDNIVKKVSLVLIKINDGLKTIKRFAHRPGNNWKAIIDNIDDYIASLPEWQRKGFYHALASELSVALSDGRLSWHEAATLTQMAYNEFRGERK